MQINAFFTEHLASTHAHAQRAIAIQRPDTLARHARLLERIAHMRFVRRTHLQHHAEFFVKQRVDSMRVSGKIQGYAGAGGKHHFAYRSH